MKTSETTKYCSLDIETSGFDPLINEVLEVGFAMFEITDSGLKITEEWTQVFKPTKEVSPQILGLTGISQQELDTAPKFSEHRELIQQKLKDAVILGHNIIFDIKFLESLGIKFSGKTIDTLDLAQVFLPTHHSYNLENLMHTFEIKHKEAHRALADAKACIMLLAKLLAVYQGFSPELKNEIEKIIKGHNLNWESFLKIKIPPLNFKKNRKDVNYSKVKLDLRLESKTIYDIQYQEDFLNKLAVSFSNQKEKILLAAPKIWQVMALWKEGLAEAIFPEELLFNENKFQTALNREDLSLEELRFLLKLLVWKHINWQTRTFLDLNLSFFGGQFKEMINGGKREDFKKTKLVCTDQQTFLSLGQNNPYKDRFVCIFGLSEFENTASLNIGCRVGWGQIIYALKKIYNPELNLGDAGKKQVVLELLTATDLFFGLASALLKSGEGSFSYYQIGEQTLNEESYIKVNKAAENFIGKLKAAVAEIKSEALKLYAENLENFFKEEANRVKWIELAESRCVFYSSPVDISGIAARIVSPYKKVAFFDSLNSEELTNYFSARLGLSDFQRISIGGVQKPVKKKNLLQGDLFSGLGKSKKPSCHLNAKSLGQNDLLALLPEQALPAVVLFASPLAAKQFYNEHYMEFKKYAGVFLSSSSGGSNKILRNFEINPKSLLLATDRFILKFLSNQNAFDTVERLPIKTLILNRLPFENYTHPYQEAVAALFADPFGEYSLPKALFNFHVIMRFFNTDKLRSVYIYDSKLLKDYAKVFKDYLAQSGNYKII